MEKTFLDFIYIIVISVKDLLYKRYDLFLLWKVYLKIQIHYFYFNK